MALLSQNARQHLSARVVCASRLAVLPAQAAAGRFTDLLDDLGRNGLNVGFFEGLVRRLKAHGYGDGFLILAKRAADEFVKTRTSSINALSAPAAALSKVSASTSLSTTKAKSRSTA